MSSSRDQRPLSHLRVLDLGHYLAGPMVGLMLADMGAKVIRIDPPGGPKWQDPAFDMLSRGKRALEIDLKSDAGQRQIAELVRRSDVVIDNFRPGVMHRLGLDPSTLQHLNPDIISLSLPGFASTDEDLRDIAAWEAIIAARTGQFTDMGLNRRLMGINPSFTPLGLASAYGAAFGAMSVLFALQSRQHSGGEHIEVPLASALLEGLVYNCEQIEDYPDRYKSPREVELERRQAMGLDNNLSFAELSEFLDPFYRTYKCADGRGFYVVACSIVTHPRRVLKVLGLESLLEDLPDFDAYLDSSDWPAPWALRNYPVGEADRQRVSEAMQAAFLTRSSTEWEEIFGAAKAPATAQRSTQEWLNDPHALASGLVLEVLDNARGTVRQMGNLAWLQDDPGAADKQACTALAPPELDAILAEQPRQSSHSAVKEKHQTGWLEGLKVLDLTNVIAGPTIGSTLARFGAEVTLVQPTQPSVDPWNAVVFGLHAQRGKQSVLLNLGSPDGKEALNRLVAQSDVITMNGTDEQRDALGLSATRLKEINPRLILVQLDAFGGPLDGPKSQHLGYDDLAQAATGVMVRFGGGPDTPEEHAHFGTIDALTGYNACVALGGALERLRVHGVGGIARASLAAAGGMIQAQFMYDFANRPPFDEPSGREVLGWDALYRCYEAADGWMFFAAPTHRGAALAEVDELKDLSSLETTALTDALAARFAQQTTAHWQHVFNGTSNAVVGLGSLHQTRDDALQRESEGAIDIAKATFRAIRHDQHPMGRWVDLVAPNAVRPQFSPIKIPGPAPKYGADTRHVLAQLGYSSTDVDALIHQGAAAESWSDKYLPE
ncbi:MAG: CoA transferase [Rhizobiaceae bacterium]|nr:CoA transferase [Rhizobiaceae bacterium]